MRLITELIRSAALGPVHLGATRTSVEGTLGPPQDQSKNRELWRFAVLDPRPA